MHGERPRDVVVRLVRRLGRELLRLEQVDGVVAVGLVEEDDEVALRERSLLHGHRLGQPRDLDPVPSQDLDHLRDAARIALALRDHEGEGTALHALLPGVVALAVEVAEHVLRVLRRPVEDREAAGLHVVRVVAERPEELLVRRPGPVPLAVRHGRVDVAVFRRAQRPLDGLRRAVAERLVSAAHRVVVGRDGVEVVEPPRLAEAPGPDARHAERRQALDLVERGLEPLGDRDRIEVHVVRAGAVPRVEQRDRLVEVVHGRRVVVVEHPVDGLRQLQGLLVRVAVVVVEDVEAPVRRRSLGQVLPVGLALEVAVEPVDGLVPAVGLRDRVDENDQVLADVADHRLLGDGEPVGELHHHLRAAGLGRVEPRVEVVDRPRRRDDLLGRLRARDPGVGEGRRRGLEPVEVPDPLLVGDRHEQDLAALFRLPDHLDTHAGRRLRERPEVAVDLGRAGELPFGSGHVAEKLRRRRHGRRGGDVRHPGAQEARLGRELRDRLGRARLGHVRRGIRRVRRGTDEESEADERDPPQESDHRAPPHPAERGPTPRNRKPKPRVI